MERVTSTVGARELKTRLGTYLKRVGRGHSFIVTDRREPVAELRPLGRAATPAQARLGAMAALGAITLPSATGLSAFAPLTTTGPLAADAIRKDRDERF